MAYYSPVAGSPFDRSNASHTQSETTAGEFWTIKKDGEDWPLIICDEEMVQRYYVKKQRPANARQPDGTWADGYKNGENGVGQRCYPTLLLGKYRCGWTPWKFLQPLDREIGQAIRISTANPELAEAWREALFYQWRDNALSYFGGHLQQELSERSHSKASIAAAPKECKRKRKGTLDFKYPPGYRMEEVDDEESSDLFVQEGNNSTPRIKQKFSDPTSSAEMEALYENTNITTSPKPFSKKAKTDTAERSYVPPTNPFRSGTINSFGRGTRQSVGRATPMGEAKKRIINDPHRVIVYVDNPHKKFNVKRSGLEASPLLKTLLAHSPEVGWYIMSPLLSTLKENEFSPIDQYLERGEYDPEIVDEGTEYVRLAIELTEAERGGEAVRCATIYSVAQRLELPGLQDLAFRKLKALATSEPHQPFAILCVVESIFDQADEDLRQYLMQCLADHYWDLVLAETVKMAEVMRGIKDLEKGVFRLLAGSVEPDADVDADVEIKEEEDDAKVEVEVPFFSDNVATEEKSNDERTLSDKRKLFGKEKTDVDTQKEKSSRKQEADKTSSANPVTASAPPLSTGYRNPTVPDSIEVGNRHKEKISRNIEVEKPVVKPVTAAASPIIYRKPTVADVSEDGEEGLARTQEEIVRRMLGDS